MGSLIFPNLLLMQNGCIRFSPTSSFVSRWLLKRSGYFRSLHSRPGIRQTNPKGYTCNQKRNLPQQAHFTNNVHLSGRKLVKLGVPFLRNMTVIYRFGASTLAFAMPVSLIGFWKRKDYIPTHEEEALSNIPREVFKKDVLIQKKGKRNIFARFFSLIWKFFNYTWRIIHIVCVFVPLLCLYPMTYISDANTVRWWKLLLYALEHLGATFIKLGQWASTRRDLFSPEFCEIFTKLHDSTRVHSWYMTKSKLRKAFGKHWREIFIKIERKPIGSGCIAQVHRAYMNANLIPDETIIDEAMDEDDESAEVDFAEGLEITGFGPAIDERVDDTERYFENKMEQAMRRQELRERAKNKQQLDTNAGIAENAAQADAQPAEEGSAVEQPNNDLLQVEPEDPPVPEGDEVIIPVAVKVLHPGIYRQVSRDLKIIHLLARFTEFIFPKLKWLSLRECVEEFADLLTQQIDLRFEAECLEQFVENFQDNPNVRFPRPIRPYCKRDVLVETLEEGEPLSDFIREDSEQPTGLKEMLASYGADALIQMVFVDNFVHGDLHPGNILVQNAKEFTGNEEETKLVMMDICDTIVLSFKPAENPIRLVMLDVGISASLSDKDFQNFKDVFTNVVIGEGEQVADLMLRHAQYNECQDVEGFKQDLGDLIMKFRAESMSLGKVQVGILLSQVFSLLSNYKVKMESNFASILIAIFVLEGLGRSLDPELDILEKAKPTLLSS